MRKYIVVVAMTLLFTPVAADELKKNLLSCSALTDSIKRLECFDRLATQEQKEADAQVAGEIGASEPTPENWDVRVSQSKIDDSTTVVLIAESQESVPGRFNRLSKPSLILRCLENTTATYINFDGHHMADIQSYGRVTFRVDKQKAFTQSMQASTDNRALGLWRGGSSIPFAKKLFGGSTLLIHATPFNESAVTFSVDISGLEEAIKPLRSACNW